MGQSPPGSTYNESGEGVPFFQGCADFGSVQPTARVFCTEPTRSARRGDVLMSVRAPVGTVNIAPFDCAIGRGICTVRHKQGSTAYAFLHLKTNAVAIDGAAGEGAVFKSLSKKQLCEMNVLAPQSSVVSAFMTIADPIFARLLIAEEEAATLANIRDLLLPRLISGKLRVEDAEAALEAV
jgi:type I restriction enzyme, S subunit